MTLLTLFKNEIETSDERNVAQDPEVRAFLDSVLWTADNAPYLSDADRVTLCELVGPPDLKATAAEMVERLDKMAPYLPNVLDDRTYQPGPPSTATAI